MSIEIVEFIFQRNLGQTLFVKDLNKPNFLNDSVPIFGKN